MEGKAIEVAFSSKVIGLILAIQASDSPRPSTSRHAKRFQDSDSSFDSIGGTSSQEGKKAKALLGVICHEYHS